MRSCLLQTLLCSFVLTSWGCKDKATSAESGSPTVAAPGAVEEPAEPVPWRVGFRLDDNPKDVFIPRPGKPDKGTAIVSFVARRAKDIATWERIELELAGGEKDVLQDIDATLQYELRQHEGAGVDLVVLSDEGSPVSSFGPLSRLHLYTKGPAEAAPRVDGKAVLVLVLGQERVEITPSDLDAMDKKVIPGGNGQSAWSLMSILANRVDVAAIRSIRLVASGEARTFSGAEVGSPNLQLHLRHNSRGELRLKVLRDGVLDSDAGLRNVARIDVELRKAK